MFTITNPITKQVVYETDSIVAARELIADTDHVINYSPESMLEFSIDKTLSSNEVTK